MHGFFPIFICGASFEDCRVLATFCKTIYYTQAIHINHKRGSYTADGNVRKDLWPSNMGTLNRALSWYQHKIGAYDKQIWEQTVEQRYTIIFLIQRNNGNNK